MTKIQHQNPRFFPKNGALATDQWDPGPYEHPGGRISHILWSFCRKIKDRQKIHDFRSTRLSIWARISLIGRYVGKKSCATSRGKSDDFSIHPAVHMGPHLIDRWLCWKNFQDFPSWKRRENHRKSNEILAHQGPLRTGINKLTHTTARRMHDTHRLYIC